jgi:hypothetical protein
MPSLTNDLCKEHRPDVSYRKGQDRFIGTRIKVDTNFKFNLIFKWNN